MRLSRRDFLKLVGIGGSAAVVPSALSKTLPEQKSFRVKGIARPEPPTTKSNIDNIGSATVYSGYNWRGLRRSSPELAVELGKFQGTMWFKVVRPRLASGKVSIPIHALYYAEAVYDFDKLEWIKNRWDDGLSPTSSAHLAVLEVTSGRPHLILT